MTTKEFFQNKWRKRAFWTATALLVYALSGFLLVPWILGRVIPKRAGEFLEREVTLEKIRINPFALSGSFQGLLIKDKDGSTLLSWGEVYGNFELSSIFHWAFTFKEVRVLDPYVNLYIRPDYTLNISDILEKAGGQPADAADNQPTSIPALRVNQINISNAVAKVSDQTLREPFTRQIGPVDLVVDNFHTDPDTQNPYSIAGSTSDGERFAWSGHFFLFPLRSDGRVTVENVQIAHYAPLYQDFVSLALHDGTVDFSAEYSVQYGGSNDVLAVTNTTFHLASLKLSADVESTENALEIGDLRVSDVEADLWNRTARVGNVALNGGLLFVHRMPDTGINLLEMAQPSNTNAEPAGAVLYAMQAVTNLIATFLTTTNQAVAVIDTVDVKDWTVRLEDDITKRPVRLCIDDISLNARNLSNVPGEDLSLDLSCRWNTNGTVKVGVKAALFPIHSDVNLHIDRIELPPLDPYVEPFANVLLLDSRFSLNGVLRIRREAMEAPFDLDFEGGVKLEDFSSVEGVMGADLLEWKALNVDGIQANLHPLEVHIDRVDIEGARARVQVETNRTINVLNALNVGTGNAPLAVPDLSKPAATTVAESDQGLLGDLGLPAVTVSSVVISNAGLELMDDSTQPHLIWDITDVNGEIGGLSSTSTQRADLRLTAKVGGTAPATITGKLNPLNPAVDTDIAIRLAGMDLVPLSPYSGRYAGYQLRKGTLNLDLDYHLRGRKLDSENLIVVNQLAFGQKVTSPEATKLPVKMGVAILKDRHGVIELDVPIEGDLDDPEFRLGRVIGRTIMNTLTKIMSSPFKLLGGLVGGSAEELSRFQFDPGSSRIPITQTNGLHKLAKALYERPALEVELTGCVDAGADGLAIRKQKLTQELKQLRWNELRESAQANVKPEDIVLSPDLEIAMLRKYFVQVFPEEARTSKAPPGLEESFYERMTNRLLDEMEVTDQDFQILAAARASAVKSWLIEQGGVAPDRLFLNEPAATPQDGSLVTLQLQ